MHRLLLLITIGLFIAIGAKPQKISKYIESQETVPLQKLYLHTDREFYFIGDTLWFSAYLLEGRIQAPLAGDFNLYVELINDNGNYVQKKLFAIQKGHSQGYLSICSKDFKEGNYQVRAYTDYLKQFDEDAFFSKTIRVSQVKNTTGLETTEAKLNSENINLKFYPEGGFLLNGTINAMAFKATCSSRKELDISGKIIDNSGKPVVHFTTSYKGMGHIYFIPDATQTYTIEIDGEEKPDYIFPEIRNAGAKLMLVSSGTKGIIVNIVTHKNQAAENYYIALFHRGKSSHYFEIGGSRTIKTINIQTKYLKDGINRLVLLNKEYEPVSERLVYCNLKKEVPIQMTINATETGTREKVEVQFKHPESLSKNEFSRLSVSVVNKNSLNSSGVTQNIKSYLLTDSELRGYIPSSADFFVDSEEMSSYGKLNLLMLTNGWTNYIWNDINKINKIKTDQELGIPVRGTIEKYFSKKTIENSEVTLSITENSYGSVYTTRTNDKGEFTFSNVLFVDTAMVTVQGKNHRGTNNTKVKIKEMGVEMTGRANIDSALLNGFSDIPVSMHRIQYLNELSLKEFYPEKGSRLLDEVMVVREGKKEDDGHGHYRIYGEPSHSGTITKSDYHFMNIFQYLQGRFAGVWVMENSVSIRGAAQSKTGEDAYGNSSTYIESNGPLFVVDGRVVDNEYVEHLPMAVIDKVEVLKGAKAAIYGVRGANGVISIFTRRGGENVYVPREIPGTIVKKIKGFAAHREFYSPSYTAENIQSEAPDYRTTLYWNPLVEMANDNTSISFYTCDNLSEYKILVEGITTEGKILLGEAEFIVNERSSHTSTN